MEYALWVNIAFIFIIPHTVLILVIVEYALWGYIYRYNGWKTGCLNPCYSGICSVSLIRIKDNKSNIAVLILVIVEYALWGRRLMPKIWTRSVLILVIVEYALWEWSSKPCPSMKDSLNPCYSGICSVSHRRNVHH